MNLPKPKSILLAVAVMMASPAMALKPAAEPQRDTDAARPLAQDTRLVLFNYDPNLTYNVLTRDGLFTHIELRPGEKIQGFYLSDTSRWKHHISSNRERVFIKPTMPGLFNSATMVTDRRVYEITLRSAKEGDPWYQRVRWNIADEDGVSISEASGVYEEAAPVRGALPSNIRDDPSAAAAFASAGSPSVRPDALNFGYNIEGEASFRPRMVFDDGRFTWIQLSSQQDLPALFSINKSGLAEVVDYTVHGNYLLVSRLVDGLLMKIGAQEVHVKRVEKCNSWFGCKNG